MRLNSMTPAVAASASIRVRFAAVVAAILAADLGLIVLDVALGSSASYPDVLRIYEERAIPEYLVYAKWAVAGGAMVWLRHHAVVYRLWALIFTYMLLDDSLMLHERAAGKLTQWVPMDAWLQLPWRAWVVVEAAYLLAIAAIGLVAVWWFVRREAKPVAARYSREALVLVAAFVAFAAVGDFLGHAVGGGGRIAELLEEGGEMVLATAIVVHAVGQAVREGARPPLRRVRPRMTGASPTRRVLSRG